MIGVRTLFTSLDDPRRGRQAIPHPTGSFLAIVDFGQGSLEILALVVNESGRKIEGVGGGGLRGTDGGGGGGGGRRRRLHQ